MARPREFDELRALDSAMFVFWQQGYAGTSLSDLEKATGLKRQSLYNTFGDKRELFSKALTRYGESAKEVQQKLATEGKSLADIRSFLLNGIKYQRQTKCGACMIVKTAFDQQAADPEIEKAVQAGSKRARAMFEKVIQRAQESGEISTHLDSKQTANYIYTMANGLSTLARTGASEKELTATLDLALSSLKNLQS